MKIFLSVMICCLALASCRTTPASQVRDDVPQGERPQGQDILTADDRQRISIFLPHLPDVADDLSHPVTSQRIALGKKLFFDEALSNPEANEGQRISCNTCHLLDNFGVDGLDRSIGILGTKVPVNAPTVYNAALHIRQFWDGRAVDVEEQALGPIQAMAEMGFDDSEASRATVLRQLAATQTPYRSLFAAAFPEDQEPFTFNNIGQAIGAFERTLLTPSRFDSFLAGEEQALSAAEKRGLKVFLNAGGSGCVSCHNGPAVGGAQLRVLGEAVPTPDPEDPIAVAAFDGVPVPVKAPGLRNITKTGPYFHNGSVASIDDAIRLMATYQLGIELAPQEVADLKSFFAALEGEIPEIAR